ncbi:hypothetical protein CAPTEDRAFT_186156 [Capitella teleta]|uniref:Uncharacterized protein n=1 Tax=Capitella teleta TaxID=283909 RepID=R7UK07_CAPTE|nr:hypothetical protein CAPTEDRAFT_186156 [Capitella teleta]|eukprot:ELU03602.1 hypothetical protein CAPTEDRAFT_186156 [Capitella teleta]
MWGISAPIVKIEPSSPRQKEARHADSISSSLTSQSDLEEFAFSDPVQSSESPEEDLFLNCMSTDQQGASTEVNQLEQCEDIDQELSGVRVMQHLDSLVRGKISQKIENFQVDVNNILDVHRGHVEQLIQFYQCTNHKEFEIDMGTEETPSVNENLQNEEYKNESSLETEAELLKTECLVKLLTKASIISRTLRKPEYQTT